MFSSHNSRVSFVDEGGLPSAQIFMSSHKFSKAGIVIEPSQPFDWSGYGDFSLAFDIANRGEVSVHLYLTCVDGNGDEYGRCISVPVGASKTYYSKMSGHDLASAKSNEGLNFDSGLRSNPPTWEDNNTTSFVNLWGKKQLDTSCITKIKLESHHTLREKQITLSRIYLVANPTEDESYLERIVDRYGQNAKRDFPGKIYGDEQLVQLCDKELQSLEGGELLPDRTRFSGWKSGPKLRATGYFRVEKVAGNWSLVTPDGDLYWSNGLDIVRLSNSGTMTGYDFDLSQFSDEERQRLTPEDATLLNHVADDAVPHRVLKSKVRAKLFEFLPRYDQPLGKHYGYRHWVHAGPIKRGEIYSFYSANLERRYGHRGDYIEFWRKVTIDRMLNWGFTSLGNWVDPSFYDNKRIPYFANGWIHGDFKTVSGGGDFWGQMPDVFDPVFSDCAEATAKEIADQVNGSPWCVGVFIDNEKSWGNSVTENQRLGIVIHTLARDGSEVPLKAEFTRRLKGKYLDIDRLNEAWQKNLESWDDFNSGFDSSITSEMARSDYSMLLGVYGDKYFEIVSKAVKRHLPNHLYCGCRFAHWGMPIEIVRASAKYADVVSYNIYEEGVTSYGWDFLKELDKPSIIGEFHFGSTSDTGFYHPGLVYSSDQRDRARMYAEFVGSAVRNPYFVGCHWFQYMDSPLTGRAHDGENFNIGFVRVTDVPYEDMVHSAKDVNNSIYEDRFGKVDRLER